MKLKEKNAISLIVLVITIIVLSILAATVIISLSNTNVISEASKTTFKSDMASYKESYEMYVASELAKNAEFDRNSLNLTYQDSEFSEIFGNVESRYKEGLKVVAGRLVYESTDDNENEILKSLNMKVPELISKSESYIGCFADVDGDGEVDGVIFADLAHSKSGFVPGVDGNLNYEYQAKDANELKDYEIIRKEYSVEGLPGFEPNLVLKAVGAGVDRFYVIALEDLNLGESYYWYKDRIDNSDDLSNAGWPGFASLFGAGKSNTKDIIEAWDNDAYGPKNELDMWGAVKEYYKKGWFVPTLGEFAAFADAFNITSENYPDYGFTASWSSSTGMNSVNEFFVTNSSYYNMDNPPGYGTVKVRLATTF